MLGYKTQMYCPVHIMRSVYRTGDDVGYFKILIAPPCDGLYSYRSEWTLCFVGFQVHGSASRDPFVSNITPLLTTPHCLPLPILALLL